MRAGSGDIGIPQHHELLSHAVRDIGKLKKIGQQPGPVVANSGNELGPLFGQCPMVSTSAGQRVAVAVWRPGQAGPTSQQIGPQRLVGRPRQYTGRL
ncbi:hypothetical protein RRG08_048542 [Elysia crispata]|uniref:Uncharacterized protein n=1 Tax=Elysia crispata TaxID=231223 RepID=A0AAE1B5L1_9GAST|nr:hypothetical protein RRG08_048542 [Elysia crispata]